MTGALFLPLLIVKATKFRDIALRCLVVQGEELRKKILFVDHVSNVKKVVLPFEFEELMIGRGLFSLGEVWKWTVQAERSKEVRP